MISSFFMYLTSVALIYTFATGAVVALTPHINGGKKETAHKEDFFKYFLYGYCATALFSLLSFGFR